MTLFSLLQRETQVTSCVMLINYANSLFQAFHLESVQWKKTNRELKYPLNTVHNRAVVLLSSPLPKPHLRRRSGRMETVYVVQSIWVGVITGAHAHVAAFLAVRTDVFPQCSRLLEAAVAEGAAARSLPSVDELVVFEVLQAAQALPTDCTHIGFLSGVCAPVFAQTVQVAEAVSTLRARVRLLSCVYAQVSFESS